MDISIIIPVYNAETFLNHCLDSVLRDPGRDFELILVDDGSNDGSLALCRDAAARDDRVRVHHQENRGPGGARNAGLELARGEYLFFVDSDDRLAPDALEVLRRAIREYRTDIVSFDYFSDDGSGELIPVRANLGPRSVSFRLEEHPEFLNSMPATWARLWRRRLFADSGIRYPDRAFYGEDLQTSCKLFALATSIVILDDYLYCYLDRPGSLMNTASPQRNRSMLDAFRSLTEWYIGHGLRRRYDPQLCALAVEHLLMATTVRVCRVSPGDPLLEEIRCFMTEYYPRWRESAFVEQLSGLRRLALWLIDHRRYRLLGLLFRLKG